MAESEAGLHWRLPHPADCHSGHCQPQQHQPCHCCSVSQSGMATAAAGTGLNYGLPGALGHDCHGLDVEHTCCAFILDEVIIWCPLSCLTRNLNVIQHCCVDNNTNADVSVTVLTTNQHNIFMLALGFLSLLHVNYVVIVDACYRCWM